VTEKDWESRYPLPRNSQESQQQQDKDFRVVFRGYLMANS